MKVERYYGRGKLLITGEYAVLDGALALAIPTAQGQSLSLKPTDKTGIRWTSKSLGHSEAWFRGEFAVSGELRSSTDHEVGQRLEQLLQACKKLEPSFLSECTGLEVETVLEFPRDWGLGSSSTLISLIAQWAHVDAYTLMSQSFGKSGSGYDLACSTADTPILYRRENHPRTEAITLKWPFAQQLLWVYMDQKQNSREAIAQYNIQKEKKSPHEVASFLNQVSQISKACADCQDLKIFEEILAQHEALLSTFLGIPTVAESRFSDYGYGQLKSLGAWGGDFILATAAEVEKATSYFKEKGYNTLLSTQQMLYPSVF
jgi:mevalonate kinase